METKQNETYYERIRREVGMEFASYVNPIGISGGLPLWWSREVKVCILGKDRNFIDFKVSSGLFGRDFLITWVYDDPEFTRRA